MTNAGVRRPGNEANDVFASCHPERDGRWTRYITAGDLTASLSACP